MADENTETTEATATAETTTETTQATETAATTTETAAEGWYTGLPNEDIRGVASKFKTEQEFFDAIGLEVDDTSGDWRAGIKDEKMRDHAGRFTTVEDLVKAHADLRGRLSKAIVPPGKDAKPEEVANYRKAAGIPETADGYEFPALPEGQEMTPEVEAQQKAWASRFHELGVPAGMAKALVGMVNEDAAKFMQAQIDADKAFVDKTEADLKSEWGNDYDRNTRASERAIMELATRTKVDPEELRHLEMKDGRFLLDHPLIRRIFAPVGLEMLEGNLGPALSETEREGINGQLATVREGIKKAQADGNSKEANRLYQVEQNLIARMQGNQPVVGSQGRAA